MGTHNIDRILTLPPVHLRLSDVENARTKYVQKVGKCGQGVSAHLVDIVQLVQAVHQYGVDWAQHLLFRAESARVHIGQSQMQQLKKHIASFPNDGCCKLAHVELYCCRHFGGQTVVQIDAYVEEVQEKVRAVPECQTEGVGVVAGVLEMHTCISASFLRLFRPDR